MNYKYKQTHKENWESIRKHTLRVGDKLILKYPEKIRTFTLPLTTLRVGQILTISHICSSSGWILFEETEQMSQEAHKIMLACGLLKGGK